MLGNECRKKSPKFDNPKKSNRAKQKEDDLIGYMSSQSHFEPTKPPASNPRKRRHNFNESQNNNKWIYAKIISVDLIRFNSMFK